MLYKIKADKGLDNIKIMTGHLKMGGQSPTGESINVNSMYITMNDKPWLPVMGEFQFSRYDHRYWQEEILKMKACGIQIIASYIFWIHHEEIEGKFDWTGNNNLRKFIKLCGENGVYVLLRIGPWVHGECRNGGLPDWILKKSKPRTNDPAYLGYVMKLYKQIATQMEGLLFKDGGPVIGVQIENELTDNESHLRTLKQMALECGIEVPIYTVTGWGGDGAAKTPRDEMIPAFGGYPDYPWEQRIDKTEPGQNYFFYEGRNDCRIGCDLLGKSDNTQSIELAGIDRYPYITCEVGPGVQSTYHRRPIITPNDVGAMAMVKIGNGVNMLGYYIFHGGSNPKGKLSTMQESKETGYPNDLPVISYDFQAPIGEFGDIRESYKYLKCLNMFLNDFGENLAPMILNLPEEKPSSFYDVNIPRFAVRAINDKGFLFVNNYDRYTKMPDKEDFQVKIQLKKEALVIPQKEFTLKSKVYFIWPFNMDLKGTLLKYATAQPLCMLKEQSETAYFFFESEGVSPEYVFDIASVKEYEVNNGKVKKDNNYLIISDLVCGKGCTIKLKTSEDENIKIVTLTKKQALNSWKGKAFGRERLIITKSNLIFYKDKFRIYETDAKSMTFSVFPNIETEIMDGTNTLIPKKDGEFIQYTPTVCKKEIEVTFEPNKKYKLNSDYFKYLFMKEKNVDNAPEWIIKVPKNSFEDVNDIYLKVHYVGSIAQVYINGKLAIDSFYNGQVWTIALKRFKEDIKKGSIILKISPLYKDDWIYLEKWPEFEGDNIAQICDVEVVSEYVIDITHKIKKE